MGYNTMHNVSVEPAIPDLDINEHVSDPFFEGQDPDIGYLGNMYAKWYDDEEDMRKLSKLYPDHLFTVHGDGDEEGDIWYKYFKNGKMQHCPAIITFDEFDEEKLE